MDASDSGHGLGEEDVSASTSNGGRGRSGDGGGEKDQDRMVEIRIKTLDSNTFTLRVHKDISVPELKERVAEETGTAVENQRLICRGKVLKDDHLLSAYNVDEGHTLHLVARRPPPATTLQQQPQQTQQQQTQPSTTGDDSLPGSDAQPRGHVSHSVLMGAINIPDTGGGLQDLNRIVSSVLNSIGLAGAIASGGAPPAGTTVQGTGGAASSAAAGSSPTGSGYGEGDDGGELDGESLGPEVEVHIDTVYGLPPGFVPPPVIPVGAGGWQVPWSQMPPPSGQTPPDALTTINQYITNLNNLIGTIDRAGGSALSRSQPSTSESRETSGAEGAGTRQDATWNLQEATQAPAEQVDSGGVGASSDRSSSGVSEVITVTSPSSGIASAVTLSTNTVALPTSTVTAPVSVPAGGQGQAPEMASSGAPVTRAAGGAPANREQPISELVSAIRSTLELMRGPGGSSISRFADQLGTQGAVNEPEARNNFRVQAMQQGTIMQRLGALLLELGRVTFSLMWQNPGREGFINPGPALYISNDHAQPIMVQPLRQYRPQIPFFNPAQAGNAQGNIAIHIHANGPDIQLPPRSPSQGQQGVGSASAPGAVSGGTPSQGQQGGVGGASAPGAVSGGTGQGVERQVDGPTSQAPGGRPPGAGGNEGADGPGGAPVASQGGVWLGPAGEAMQAIFCSIDSNGQLTVHGRSPQPGTAGAGQADAPGSGQNRPAAQGQSMPHAAPNMAVLPPQAVLLPAAALTQMWRTGRASPPPSGPTSQAPQQPGATPLPPQNRAQVQMQTWGPTGTVAAPRRPFGVSAVSFATGPSPSPSSVSVFAPPFISPRAGAPPPSQGEQRTDISADQGQATTNPEPMDQQQAQSQQQQAGMPAGAQISDFAARSVMSIMESIMAGLRPPSGGEPAAMQQEGVGVAGAADGTNSRGVRENTYPAGGGVTAASGSSQATPQGGAAGANPAPTATGGHPQGVDPAAVMSSILSALQPFLNMQQQGHYQVHLAHGQQPQQQQQHQHQQQQHQPHQQRSSPQQQQQQGQQHVQTTNLSQQPSLSSREQEGSCIFSRPVEVSSDGVARMETSEVPSVSMTPPISQTMETSSRPANEHRTKNLGSVDETSGLGAATASSCDRSAGVFDAAASSREAAVPGSGERKSGDNAHQRDEQQSAVKIQVTEQTTADASSSARSYGDQGGHALKENKDAQVDQKGKEAAKPTPPALGLGISGLSPLPARPRRRAGSHSARPSRPGSEAGCRETREDGTDGAVHCSPASDPKVVAREMLLELAGGESLEDARREGNFASTNGLESGHEDGERCRHSSGHAGDAGRTSGPAGGLGDALGGLLGAIGGGGGGTGGGLGAALGGLMSSISPGDRRREGSAPGRDDVAGFREIVGQLMQSPVVDDMMMQMLGSQAVRGGVQHAVPGGSGAARMGPGGESGGPDLASMMSQMMPMVAQMLGGMGGGADLPDGGGMSSSRNPSGLGAVEGGGGSSRESNGLGGMQEGDADEWKAALSKEEAAEWSDTVRRDQTEQQGILQRPLSEAYIRGSPSKRQRRGVVEGCGKKGDGSSIPATEGSSQQENGGRNAGSEQNINSEAQITCEQHQRSEADRPLETRMMLTTVMADSMSPGPQTLSGRRRSRAEMEQQQIELEDSRSTAAADLCLSLSPPGNCFSRKV